MPEEVDAAEANSLTDTYLRVNSPGERIVAKFTREWLPADDGDDGSKQFLLVSEQRFECCLLRGVKRRRFAGRPGYPFRPK
jgi:hypothetical protein